MTELPHLPSRRISIRKLGLIAGSLFISGFMTLADQPKLATGIWAYNQHRFGADSSYWEHETKSSLHFVMLDRARKKKANRIAVVFNQRTISERDYKIVDFVRADSEIAINIIESTGNIGYVSSSENAGYVHVRKSGNKHYFWANDVSMNCWPRFANCTLDSFKVSFNLKEF